MRISDWSADVCSSDLYGCVELVEQSVVAGHREILLAVAGSGVDVAGAVLVGHVFAEQDRDLALGVERMADDQVLQFHTLGATVDHEVVHRKSTRLNSSH